MNIHIRECILVLHSTEKRKMTTTEDREEGSLKRRRTEDTADGGGMVAILALMQQQAAAQAVWDAAQVERDQRMMDMFVASRVPPPELAPVVPSQYTPPTHSLLPTHCREDYVVPVSEDRSSVPSEEVWRRKEDKPKFTNPLKAVRVLRTLSPVSSASRVVKRRSEDFGRRVGGQGGSGMTAEEKEEMEKKKHAEVDALADTNSGSDNSDDAEDVPKVKEERIDEGESWGEEFRRARGCTLPADAEVIVITDSENEEDLREV
ncbi:hypothetical protein B0H19DRAFT_1248740 [Mycena capillaripes]|nr:hypothetical protein B0H19DRAFT_1248740 [Mycena capillaripes]